MGRLNKFSICTGGNFKNEENRRLELAWMVAVYEYFGPRSVYR